MAQILDGKAIAAEIRQGLKEQVAGMSQPPGLAVILVGDDPASQVYVRNKQKACQEVGFYSELISMAADTDQAELIAKVKELNQRSEIHGILVQLPLPDHMDAEAVIEAIDPAKDVDGFHPYNIGRLLLRMPLLRPCTPKGVMSLLERTGIELAGKDAVIIGQSNIVGRPMALELLMAGCTITVCHSRTRNLIDKVRQADIVVAAVGRPEMIQGDWIKPGAVVIDVGINRREDGRLCGDVHFDSAAKKASWITPVPGGVGPMTVASLLQNTLQAAMRSK